MSGGRRSNCSITRSSCSRSCINRLIGRVVVDVVEGEILAQSVMAVTKLRVVVSVVVLLVLVAVAVKAFVTEPVGLVV